MLFIIRSLIYLFASVMCIVGIFFTYQDADNECFKIFKLLVLILGGIVFIVFSLQDFIDFIKIVRRAVGATRRWAIIYRLEVQMHQSLQDWVGYIILSIYIFIIILEIIL